MVFVSPWKSPVSRSQQSSPWFVEEKLKSSPSPFVSCTRLGEQMHKWLQNSCFLLWKWSLLGPRQLQEVGGTEGCVRRTAVMKGLLGDDLPTQSRPSFLNHLDLTVKFGSTFRNFITAILNICVFSLKQGFQDDWAVTFYSKTGKPNKNKDGVLMLLNESFCFRLFLLSCNSDALLALLLCPEQPQQCLQALLKSFLSLSSSIAFHFTNKP